MKAKNTRIWNNYELANETSFGEPLKLAYGTWRWQRQIFQKFDKTGAEKIREAVKAIIAKDEPGLPVYQGHPDVPELAARYPDKGAIGWIKRVEVGEKEALLFVEWDRFPGKGFGWMSPYWGGKSKVDSSGKVMVEVEEMYSLGLVNNPNIRDFRLPNEESELTKGKRMKLEDILKLLGFAEDATPVEIKAKCQELVNALEARKAAEAKAKVQCEEAEKKASDAAKALENANTQLAELKKQLENAKKDAEDSKKDLANSKAEVEKLKSLKTV